MGFKRKAVVLLSGGLDSATLLWTLMYEDYAPTALSVHYGQRHRRELVAARTLANLAGVPYVHVDAGAALAPIFEHAESSQVGKLEPVPHGHYAAPNMSTTVVPNRNMLLLSIAGALAKSIGAKTIAYAAHAGDHPIYPDCRPEFMACMADAFLKSETADFLYAPFANISKTDIVRRADQLGVPVGSTYSCYEGQAIHCGRCGTCVERKEAFTDSGVFDPTQYAA